MHPQYNINSTSTEANHQKGKVFTVFPKINLARARSARISREKTRVKTNEHAARQIEYPRDMRCPFVGGTWMRDKRYGPRDQLFV